MSNLSKTLTLIAMGAILTEKVRTDGKVSRQYYTAEFGDQSNPFGQSVKRVIWQQHSADGKTASWRAGNPAQVKLFIGKQVPAEIVCLQVPAYDVQGGDGVVRQATKYTTVVFAHETVNSVFKSAGHPLEENTVINTTVPAVQVSELQPSLQG